MKKRIFALVATLALLLSMLAVGFSASADEAGSTFEWKASGNLVVQDAGYEHVTEFRDGYYWLKSNDIRASIDTPNLDEGPYYMALGVENRIGNGHWLQMTISNGERNANWYAVGDLRIQFPNPANANWIVQHNTNDGKKEIVTEVPFIPHTAYVFKFAKEQVGDTAVLAIYINGVRVYESAEALSAFSGEKLWFTTTDNYGDHTAAKDTLGQWPIFINPELGDFQEPEYYFTAATKGGAFWDNDAKKYYTSIVEDGLYVLYDQYGYAHSIMNCSVNDSGGGGMVGESAATDFANPNKGFEIIVNPKSMYNGNWNVQGIYNPAKGILSPTQNGDMIRISLNGGGKLVIDYYWGTSSDSRIRFTEAKTISWNNDNRVRFELVEGNDAVINAYLNDELMGSVKESDANMAGLFDILRAETLRTALVGHVNANNAAQEKYDIFRLKVSTGYMSASLKLEDGDFYATGDIVTANIKVENKSGKDQELQIASKYSPHLVAITGDRAVTVKNGETVELKQTFRAIQGGRPTIGVTVSANGKVLTEAKQIISVSGPGWYRGDSHSHTIYSDGAGTVAQNCASAYSKGLSWLYSTDHNNIEQWKHSAEVNATYTNGDFFNIGGIEYTTKNLGHSLGFRLDHEFMGTTYPGYGYKDGGWIIGTLGGTSMDYQDVIDYNNNMGGIFYAAHPNALIVPTTGNEQRWVDIYNVTGVTGIEVWNAAWSVTHVSNKGAMKMWDTLNVRGDHVYGISNSDGHGLPAIGANHIKGYMTSLNADNLHALLENGHYYGTNGPDIYLDVNGVGMGDTLKIGADSTDGKIVIKANDDNYPLTKVTLYKLHVTGEISDKAAEVIMKDGSANGAGEYYDTNLYTDTKEVVKEWDLTGKGVSTFSEVVELTIEDGDFFRVEVWSEKNTFYDYFVAANADAPGFAYSNPVWVEKATKTNDLIIESMNVKGGTVEQTMAGAYYVRLDDASTVLTADDLTVTMAGNAKVTAKSYSDEGKVFSLTISTEDGATKGMTVYVLAEPDADFDFSTVYPTDTPATEEEPDDNKPGDDNTGDDNKPGDDNTGDDNTGDDNTGDDNTGDDNTGDDNKPSDDNKPGDDDTDGENKPGDADKPSSSPVTGVALALAPFILLVMGAVAMMFFRNKKASVK